MMVIDIDIGHTKKSAKQLNLYAGRYVRWSGSLSETVSWLKQQEAKELYAVTEELAAEIEALDLQRKRWIHLSEALQLICETYHRTETQLEKNDSNFKRQNSIQTVSLTGLKNQIQSLGIEILDL